MAGLPRQRVRDGAESGADFDDDVVLGGVHRTQNCVDDGRIRQEVLTESLARTMPAHQRAASAAASSTAASRLPASARPLPAISNAVP